MDAISLPLSHTPPPRTGWSLLALLMFMAVLSAFLLHWYQNEIQFRLQAEVALQHQLLHQQLEGVITKSLLDLQNFSEDHLRTNTVTRGPIVFSSFFPQWSMRSLPAQEDPILTVELQHQSLGVPVSFEVLLYFHSYFLSDFPWFDSSPIPSDSLPDNLIISRPDDLQRSNNIHRFSLQQTSIAASFDYVFHGNTEILWEQDQMKVIQGENEWELTEFLREKLQIQIQGDVTIIGTMGHHAGKLVFLEAKGDLILQLPAGSADFSTTLPSFFAHVTGKTHVQAKNADHVNVQVNGYFWIEDACPLAHAALQAVYWNGSLACPLERSATWQVPLHLRYAPPTQAPPDTFVRTALQLGGVRPMNQ